MNGRLKFNYALLGFQIAMVIAFIGNAITTGFTGPIVAMILVPVFFVILTVITIITIEDKINNSIIEMDETDV